MVVEFGPQGLYMLTPSVRVQGMHAGVAGRTGNSNDPLIELEAYLGSELIGGSAREYLGLTQTAVGDERLGIFMPFTAELSTYVGQNVRIHAVVSDACGASASDDLTVLAQQ